MQQTPLGGFHNIQTRQGAPLGTVSRTTGPRKDHCASIMLGGEGPGEVGLPSTIASANRENSCTHAPEAQALQLACTPIGRKTPGSLEANTQAGLPRSLYETKQCLAICPFCALKMKSTWACACTFLMYQTSRSKSGVKEGVYI